MSHSRSRYAARVAIFTMLIAIATSCALSHARPSPRPARTVAFKANSLRSVFGIQGRFDGKAELRDGWMYASISSGAVKTWQRDARLYWDLRLRVGIASCDTSGDRNESHIVSESRAQRLAPALGITESAGTLDTTTRAFKGSLGFDLGIPPGLRLDRSWIVLIFEWPFENTFATYELQTDAPLGAGGTGPRRVRQPGSDPASFKFSCR